jgi:hypothetical protein
MPSPAPTRFQSTNSLPTTRFEVRSLWHERHEGDAAQDWLHRRSTEHLRAGTTA